MALDDNSSPTISRFESTTIPRAQPTNIRLTPTSSAITSKAQAHRPLVIPMIPDTTVLRDPTHFVMKQSNSSKDLVFTRAQTEDGVEIRIIFLSGVRLNSTVGSSEAVVEQRAIRCLP